MTTVETLLDRLRTHIYLRNIMPEDWFEDFDHLHSGRITVSEFRRCFPQLNIRLSDEEFNLLVNRYQVGDKVNYRAFCREIEDIYTNRDLEKTPHGTTVNSGEIVSRTLGKLGSTEDPQLEALMAKLYHQVQVRGVHLRDTFMDFDKHNNGTVTQSQFARANPFRDLNATEMALLYKRYSDPVLRDFNYRRLNNDINDYGSKIPTQVIQSRNLRPTINDLLPHQAKSIQVKNFDKNPDELISKFAEHVRKERIRILDFFESHDQLHTGRISVQKFTGTLTLFGYPFTKNDLSYLANEYKINVNFTEFVKYKEFCKDVEDAINLQLSPVKQRAAPKPQNNKLKEIIERLKSQVTRFRINALPTIQDFDRHGRGYITPIQLHRALTTLRLNITNEEREILCQEYETDKGIDIYRFIEDIDPTHTQKRRQYLPIGDSKESIERTWGIASNGDKFVTPEVADKLLYESKKGLISKIGEAKDITSLLHEMYQWSYVNGVFFSEFLETFDTHNWGEITEEHFRSGIQISGFKLTEAEFDILRDEYASPTRKDYICWRRFDNDIKSFTAPQDLEKTPTVTPVTLAQLNKTTERALKVVTPQVRQILEEIAKFVTKKRLCLLDQFRDFDKMNHLKINASRFTRVLQLIGCYLSKSRIDTLVSYYNDPYTNFVDYGLFVKDVDEMTGQLFGDNHTQIVSSGYPNYGNPDSEYLVSVRSGPIAAPTKENIMKKLQSFVYKRRVRLHDFFLSFDSLRRGVVSKQKFHTVVGQAELPLTGDEIEFCLSEWEDPERKDMFNYRNFLKEVNAVFGPTELAKTPLKDPSLPGVIPEPSKTIQTLTPTEENFVQIIMRRMKEKVSTRRMNIRDQFEDYDRKPHKRYITKQQFRQSIARLGLSTDKYELDALCKKYKNTDLDEVNYDQFCIDLDS